jgi:hypothetical protein
MSAVLNTTPEALDAEREAHIVACGNLMQAAYARYEAHGCFGDRGEANYWRRVQAEAIAARSPEQVVRMEAARGLANA